MATASIGTAAGFLAKEGNDKIGWTEVCSYFHRFCSRAESSVAFSFIGLLLFLLICTISHAYALKNKQQENLQQSPSP
ncbi:CASP-like protein [Apostasia shenzhenica]|uniref:CASP-like protein n=1 Tax=Apostasia shenzhenica TaxID=1088818 RepID=A0A2I0A6X7_9ASPA|nr:CASP-like protein [Apostasia shenzhenica]